MRVAIVGFGIGGATLALALARDGNEVTVYEQAADLGPVGAGFLLQPSGQAVLGALGLLDEVAAASWPIHAFHAESAPGRTLAELRYDRGDPTRHALGVARGRLFMILMAAAARAGVRLVTGTTIVDAVDQGDAVAPIAADGSGLSSVDLLVGADGLWSKVRRVVDPSARLRISPHAALWGIGTSDERCPDRLRQQARGVGILAGLLPVGEHEVAVFWGVPSGDVEGLHAAGFDAFVDRVAAVLPAARPALASIAGFDRLTLARYGSVSVRRRHVGRIVLIGDAAHATTPHLGQGANLALLDAASLATVLRTTARPEDALRGWDDDRRWQNARYALLSRILSPFFQSSHASLGMPRDIGLPLMARFPPTRSVMERVLAGRG